MSKRKYKQRFSAREMAITETIRKFKGIGYGTLTREDLLLCLKNADQLPKDHIRQSVLMTMNGLCRKLNASGIYIQKSRTLGRGNKSIWYLSKEIAFSAAQKGNSHTSS